MIISVVRVIARHLKEKSKKNKKKKNRYLHQIGKGNQAMWNKLLDMYNDSFVIVITIINQVVLTTVVFI